jgi:hypothetical protein
MLPHKKAFGENQVGFGCSSKSIDEMSEAIKYDLGFSGCSQKVEELN